MGINLSSHIKQPVAALSFFSFQIFKNTASSMGDTSFSTVSVKSKWRKKRGGKKAVEEYDSFRGIWFILIWN